MAFRVLIVAPLSVHFTSTDIVERTKDEEQWTKDGGRRTKDKKEEEEEEKKDKEEKEGVLTNAQCAFCQVCFPSNRTS